MKRFTTLLFGLALFASPVLMTACGERDASGKRIIEKTPDDVGSGPAPAPAIPQGSPSNDGGSPLTQPPPTPEPTTPPQSSQQPESPEAR